jgi:hypothetical protein
MIEESKSFNIPGGDEIIQLILDAYDTELFVTHTVGELITGYEDPLLKIAKAFLPNLVKDTKFSILNGVSSLEFILNCWPNRFFSKMYISAQRKMEPNGKIIQL